MERDVCCPQALKRGESASHVEALYLFFRILSLFLSFIFSLSPSLSPPNFYSVFFMAEEVEEAFSRAASRVREGGVSGVMALLLQSSAPADP